MFEVSHRLIGIYKVANATKSKCPIFQRGLRGTNGLYHRCFNRQLCVERPCTGAGSSSSPRIPCRSSTKYDPTGRERQVCKRCETPQRLSPRLREPKV